MAPKDELLSECLRQQNPDERAEEEEKQDSVSEHVTYFVRMCCNSYFHVANASSC